METLYTIGIIIISSLIFYILISLIIKKNTYNKGICTVCGYSYPPTPDIDHEGNRTYICPMCGNSVTVDVNSEEDKNLNEKTN